MNASFLLLLALAAGDLQGLPATDKPEKAGDAGDRMICKKFIETGSLVKGKRVCMTKAGWERQRLTVQGNVARGLGQSVACASMASGITCN
ncbi:hypothetical protein HL653_19555 [Sphingomonas sp. AP4-R1]|uniref:hypothetical protein n=1 Tax=Sphingomonas sp. AP4-R1 TaxID=2735134 RepID=UPI001493A4F8|nr:hypothetical protein [Sphingomonas sp. AP4-R1]QJU59657.1 hypothetical protein HL653_19555 [Sphingomonas sp. AP4-R1]